MTTVYVKPACVQCDMTKRFLDKNNIPYETVDITQDPAALSMVIDLGFSSAPVVITSSDAWAGFQPEKLQSLAA